MLAAELCGFGAWRRLGFFDRWERARSMRHDEVGCDDATVRSDRPAATVRRSDKGYVIDTHAIAFTERGLPDVEGSALVVFPVLAQRISLLRQSCRRKKKKEQGRHLHAVPRLDFE